MPPWSRVLGAYHTGAKRIDEQTARKQVGMLGMADVDEPPNVVAFLYGRQMGSKPAIVTWSPRWPP